MAPLENTALVTGATGAIGQAIALGIAEKPGWSVVLACRDRDRGMKARNQIVRLSGNERVEVRALDLSRHEEISRLAGSWSGKLTVLVNNAAVAPPRREETPEGIERVLATNVLAYRWMVEAFAPALAASGRGRVVNVASYWAGDLAVDDLQFLRRRYDNNTAYRQSKQANRMLTVLMAEELEAQGIMVNACHPGDVNSKLSRDLGFGGHESPAEGARTPVWLATAVEVERTTGRYFEAGRETPCPFARDRRQIDALAAACDAISARA